MNKRLVFLYLAVFAMFAFSLGHDAGRWDDVMADQGGQIGFVIHAFAAIVFCGVLVRQIHSLKDPR